MGVRPPKGLERERPPKTTMAKVEVQIRRCCCCGLSMGATSIALYCLILFSILTGLAAWGLSDTNEHGDASHYNSCELEAQGKINADNRKLVFTGGQTTVVVEDSTSYHCSFGLYTEELKYTAQPRYLHLIVDILIYIGVILCSLLLLVGVCTYSYWCLAPWLVVMLIEIVRGLISCFFMFWYSHGNLARLAAAIFFTGLQIFHMSLWVLILAKFQRIYNIKHGNYIDRPYDTRVYPGGGVCPAPSTYAYSPDMRRADFYPPEAGHAPAGTMAPPPPPGSYYADQRYRY
ncbi:hypothetical protein PRIPAC_92246 [Pristionchus pacificus]|uniref:Uncharacterized protein n=1 Tax=Pristionchus pacificus TaxID=54126 RepID=A0A2A6BQ60_PRIPA|nr:hypothetical protein PRIPAC_92246 [Pristionchus pacificus]|eukprot:PDM67913.1 hypothetical protein PRIPAC_45957 [Pristionchus pacificus]